MLAYYMGVTDGYRQRDPGGAVNTPIDFSGTMGSECCISRVHDGGQRLSLYGWTWRIPREGDHLILAHADRKRTARYRVTSVRRPGDPSDMWFGEATFDPRTPAPWPLTRAPDSKPP